MSLMEAGDHLVSGDDLYGGTNCYIQKILSKQGVKHTFVDITNVQNVIDAIQPNTKVK
jgi:O-acetylhomoserine/O-acetylserine sulfhydrylase-like pyridoxal-dependent enzyme